MKVDVFSIYDVQTCVYHPPIFMANVPAVKRALRRQIPQNPAFETMNAYPEDFRLYKVGTWNDHDGLIEPIHPTEFVCDISELAGPNAAV